MSGVKYNPQLCRDYFINYYNQNGKYWLFLGEYPHFPFEIRIPTVDGSDILHQEVDSLSLY